MNIAFDVKGTLDGEKAAKLRDILVTLRDIGHKVYVWSNSYGYAVDMVKKLEPYLSVEGESVEAISKYTRGDAKMESKTMMDIAFEDDESQTWLAAKKFVFVREIPNNFEEYKKWKVELIKFLAGMPNSL